MTTFHSSSLTCPATQSGLCGLCSRDRIWGSMADWSQPIQYSCMRQIFWTALSERRGGLELSRGRSQRQDSFGHEPALVARSRSAAKLLLGFFKFVGIPRCNDHRRCHPCCWHSQGGPAALASCRTSEQLRRLEVLTSHSCRSRASTCVFRPRF